MTAAVKRAALALVAAVALATACSSRSPLATDAGAPAGGGGSTTSATDAAPAGTSGAAGGGGSTAGVGGPGGTTGSAGGTTGSAGTGGTGGTNGGAGTSGGAGGTNGGAAGSATGGAGTSGGAAVQQVYWTARRNLDLLFMVDNSASMTQLQSKLVAAFPMFMSALKGLPDGLPDLHVAVISSDLGAGPSPGIYGCNPGGDQGRFQIMPRGTTCAAGSLNAGQTFISNIAGVANYTGDISDVFGCIAPLGSQGCGFEHQLASVMRALGADGAAAPAQNSGFLRPNAVLAIVLLTNEDDCSAPPDATIFDQSSMLVSDPLGPLSSYRCNEQGHLCGGKAPPRTPAGPTDLSGTCTSNENGPLYKVADVVARLKALKADPAQVILTTITAPPTPYIVGLTPPTLKDDPSQWPTIEHSCMAADGTYGDPAIRLENLTDAFGANASTTSICADGYTHALDLITTAVNGAPVEPCITAKLFDSSPTAPGVQPSCTFVDHTDSVQGLQIDTPLPTCANGSAAAPCGMLTKDAICGTGWLVNTLRGAQPPPMSTTVSCDVCKAGDTRSGCAY